MKTIFIIATALMLSACVATGKKVTQEKVSQFEIGKTTYQEVIQELGEPTDSTLRSDGSREITYSYAQSQMKAQNFIPYVGGFLGGRESESSFVYMSFNKRGVLTHYSARSGKQSTGTGLISGQRQ